MLVVANILYNTALIVLSFYTIPRGGGSVQIFYLSKQCRNRLLCYKSTIHNVKVSKYYQQNILTVLQVKILIIH